MSKISVFRFNLNNVSISRDAISVIVKEFLETKGFYYNFEKQCYMIGIPNEKQANKAVASAVLYQSVNEVVDNDRTVSCDTFGNPYLQEIANDHNHPCFEFQIINNELVIKAYLYNAFSSIKSYIHVPYNTCWTGRIFCEDLKNNLFSKLEKNGVMLMSTSKEKIADNGNKKLLAKVLIAIIPAIILYAIITLIAYYSSH